MLEETNKYCLWRKTKAIPVTVMSHNHPVRIDRRQPLARPGPKMSPARCICPIHVIDLTSRISIDRSAARRTWCAHWLSDLGACVIMSSHHRPNYKSQDKSSVPPTKKGVCYLHDSFLFIKNYVLGSLSGTLHLLIYLQTDN